MSKKITNKKDMLDAIKTGMSSIADIVGRTLGPGGLPILLERTGQALNGDPLGPLMTKDGVTVASYCASNEELPDLVIQAIKEICQKTNRVAGDGTTTAIVLGQALLEQTLREAELENVNLQRVQREILRLAAEIDAKLVKMAVPVKNLEEIEHVATISANGDREMGSIIRKAFESVGAEGVVIVDEGSGTKHTLEVVNGYQFKRGAEAQDRFFNNPQNTKFEAENVHIVLYNGKLTSIPDALHAMQVIHTAHAEQGKSMPPVVFVANEFSPDVLQFLLINRAEAKLSVCAVRAPNQTTMSTVLMDDMAYFLGGNRLGDGTKSLSAMTFEDVGVAKKIVVDKYTTTMFDGAGDEEEILARIDQLKAQRDTAESVYDASNLSDRIASLSEGVAKIGVGAVTDLELKEKYHRMEDAVNAARAAIEQGIVPGGGTTLFRIAQELDFSRSSSISHRIFAIALTAPFYQILDNLGMSTQDIQEITKQLESSDSKVYDGISGSIVDAFEAGIIDPVKITRTALENAVSIASLLATCGGAITITRK